jgi:hypothetical protein
MIILEGIDVCSIAWYTIMGISKATYYHWKVNANNGMCTNHDGNVGTTKLRIHTREELWRLERRLYQNAFHHLGGGRALCRS